MQIVLTGANSFLGRHVTTYLAGRGHRIFGTYRHENTAVAMLRARIDRDRLSLHAIDMADASAFAALPPRIDAVVHIAGVSPAPGVRLNDMLACNVTGASNLLRYAADAGARKLVYASTVSVHGRIFGPEVTENTPIVEPDAYGASKYLGERIFAERIRHLPVCAIRLPGTVLGKGARRTWIPTLAANVAAGRPFKVFNPNAPFNNAAYVDDLARLVDNVLTADWNGFHAFPVGASGTIPVRAVVEAIFAALGKPAIIDVAPPDQPAFTISSDYASRVFGYRPQHISDMVRRYATEYFVGLGGMHLLQGNQRGRA